MENRLYPKVLLFGHSFNNSTGMGITLTNLFAEWPLDRIAVFANEIDVELSQKIRPCTKYIGNHKISINGDSQKVKRHTYKDTVRENLRSIYHKTGLNEIKASCVFPESYYSEAIEYNPDIVFCALGSYIAMKRCEYLMTKLPNAKLVLYIVDDWVNTKINKKYFSFIWRNIYDRSFRKLMDKSSGLLSICQYMSDAYHKQYGKVFYPFHNPVNIEEWNQLEVKLKYPVKTISILYVGKINEDTTPCLLDMSKVVSRLNSNEINFVFDIYSPDYACKAYLFEREKGTHVFGQIAHEDIPIIMKSYSSLFLPLGFSNESRTYVRLSMPTKLTEYLASNRPIILYCPEEIALAKYLIDKDCSIICTNNDKNRLMEAVVKLQDKDNYNHLVVNSAKLAEQHDIHVIRERFKTKMCEFGG